MYYLIYKITNIINGKIYIGSHKTTDINDDYMGSGKYLKNAINKHGIENFTKEILFSFDNHGDMYKKEAEIVNEDFISESNTYNIKKGGFGGFDYINSLNLNNKTNQNSKGGKNSSGFTGKSHTDEAKRKISLKNSGNIGSFLGKTHSDESKKKMSKIAKERLSDPCKNSQYGTIWIYNIITKQNKKINAISDIPPGWTKGRILK
jgi:group I intron endonuclease